MAKTEEEKAINKIERSAIKAMTELGVYRKEFKQTIQTYARLKWQHERMFDEFIKNGCETVEEYKNKSGEISMRKTPEYQIMENLRKDILTYENTLGLTPAGLRRLKNAASLSEKISSLLAGIVDP